MPKSQKPNVIDTEQFIADRLTEVLNYEFPPEANAGSRGHAVDTSKFPVITITPGSGVTSEAIHQFLDSNGMESARQDDSHISVNADTMLFPSTLMGMHRGIARALTGDEQTPGLSDRTHIKQHARVNPASCGSKTRH